MQRGEVERQIRLEIDNEFRFEVEFDAKVRLKLLEGKAEIFGTELAIGIEYTFSGQKAAVYTWHGCLLEIKGQFLVEYTASETPMNSYLNTHLALQNERQLARQQDDQGPRVLVVGPHDVGKTSLCKILASYAQRQGEKPIYVSLDTAEGLITMPGTVTATSINHMLDVEEGFGSSATSMDSQNIPAVYYYGYENPKENPKLYKLVVSRLAHAVRCRAAKDADARTSGYIIDTFGLIDQVGYDLIQHTIDEFSVNVVIVLGHERLYSDMNRLLSDKKDIKVIKLNKSGGVVERDREFRMHQQRSKIQEYFYGPNTCLSSTLLYISFDDLHVWRVSEALAPSSALPLGMEGTDNETRVVKVDNYDLCLHSILAILHADVQEHDSKLLESSLVGFFYVSEVDDVKKRIRVLNPFAEKLPPRPMLLGAFKWMDK